MAFQESRSNYFLQILASVQLQLLNLDFNEIFFAVKDWHILKTYEKVVMYQDWRKSFGFWDTRLRSEFQFAPPRFLFFFFVKTWTFYAYTYLALYVKLSVSIFIISGDIKHWIFPTYSPQTHLRTQKFSETKFFWVSGPQSM